MVHPRAHDRSQRPVQVKKDYTKVVCNLAKAETSGIHYANQMGQPGIRATETIWCLRMLAGKARVLNKLIAVAQTDIQNAFYAIQFDAIHEGLLQQGVTPKTRIAIMIEFMN